MSNFKNEQIAVLNELTFRATEMIHALTPMLASRYCDEDADQLDEIWDGSLNDMLEEIEADFNPYPMSKWARDDCYFVNRLMNEVAGFIQICMENDW